MKRLVYLAFLVMVAFVLGTCAKATSQSTDETIEPGDKIGDFLITTGGGEDVTYNWKLDSAIVQQGNTEIYTVQIPIGTKMNVSIGIYDSTFRGNLDSLWSGHTYEMFIEDRPVNLQAFGSIDVTHPIVGKMRYWNVVIFATKSGEITVVAKGAETSGSLIDDTKIYTFSTP